MSQLSWGPVPKKLHEYGVSKSQAKGKKGIWIIATPSGQGQQYTHLTLKTKYQTICLEPSDSIAQAKDLAQAYEDDRKQFPL